MRMLRVVLALAMLGSGLAVRAQSGATVAVPPPPDYAQATAWAALPQAPGEAAGRPHNASAVALRPKVDVFYIHPTTFQSRTQWNAALDDAATNQVTDHDVVARQASVFNGCCRIYAPRYRQASLRAVLEMAGEGARAYDLAYTDVLRAFDWYLQHDNQSRPFILVGHSQGGLHLARLLRDRIDGTPLGKRLVAAYVLGYPLARGEFSPSLVPCNTPRQTGCVIAWNSFLANSDASAFVARGKAQFAAAHGTRPGNALLCSNPLGLSGQRRTKGLGALPLRADTPLPPLIPASVSAACDHDGVLRVTLDPSVNLAPLPGGSMHYHDVALFYADLRQDALRRSSAFGHAHRHDRPD